MKRRPFLNIDNQFSEKMCCKGDVPYKIGVTEEQQKDYYTKMMDMIEKKKTAMKNSQENQLEAGFFNTQIFHNGTIYTMDSKDSVVEAVAIRGKKIICCGSYKDIKKKYDGILTKHHDLEGKAMFPGFVEPHSHQFYAAMDNYVDVSPFQEDGKVGIKYEKVVQKIKDEMEKQKHKHRLSPQKRVVIVKMYDPLLTCFEHNQSPSALFNKNNLDAIYDKDIPLVIIESNTHIVHCNSKALALANITYDTKIPEGGDIIKENGQLTGEIREPPAVEKLRPIFLLNRISLEGFERGVKKIFTKCNAKGVTTFYDCGFGSVSAMLELAIVGKIQYFNPTLRFGGYVVGSKYKLWKELKIKPNHHDELFRLNGMKLWADGSTQGKSAYFKEAYLNSGDDRGKAVYTQKDMNQLVAKGFKDGWKIGIHCNGDAAIDMAICALSKLPKNMDRRLRIEHCTICEDDQFKKMKQNEIYPSFLIGHTYYYGDAFRDILLGEKRANLCDRMKTAVELGLRPTMHSDYLAQPIDPIRCIYNAVTRHTLSGKVLNAKECIKTYQAIKAITIDAAWQCNMEQIVGSIENNKLADFVILDKDPIKDVSPIDIMKINVEETWFNGTQVYKRSK